LWGGGAEVWETGDRGGEEAGVFLAELFGREPPRLERTREEVLDEDVGAAREALDELAPVLARKVRGHGFLPPVHGEEVRRLALERWRRPAARRVAAPRALHLHDARTEIGQ